MLQAKPPQPPSNKTIYEGFKLPINYLDAQFVHTLSPQVASDLELSSDGNMYSHILSPQHDFAKNIQTEWSKQYTTNVPFLLDTQSVLKSMPVYLEETQKYY